MGISIRSLQDWESGKKTVSRKSWQRYFKEKAYKRRPMYCLDLWDFSGMNAIFARSNGG